MFHQTYPQVRLPLQQSWTLMIYPHPHLLLLTNINHKIFRLQIHNRMLLRN
ncbi:unnamed protein product [Meloidogyne enterolobii]|uniref:Uncharacterized protein n=1 Tax=Meloidogyne enterolobii TaxID=390850 RepID=A0ACB0XRZ4_MELEN